MIFVIIYGTSIRRKNKGIVAARCQRCDGVQRHMVIECSRVAHVFFIPVGSPTPFTSIRRCEKCGVESECDPARYDRIVDESASKEMGIDQLLAATNTRLLAKLNEEAAADGLPSWSDKSEGAAPPIGENAATSDFPTQTVRELRKHAEADAKATPLLDAFRSWTAMSNDDRGQLKIAVDRYLARRTKMLSLGETFKKIPDRGGLEGVGCLYFLAAAVAISAIWWLPLDWPTYALIGYVVAIIVAGFVLSNVLESVSNRRWMRNKVIPIIEARHNPVELCEYLKGLETRDGSVPHEVFRIADEWPKLEAELRAQGRM